MSCRPTRRTEAPLGERALGAPGGRFVLVEWADPGGPPGPPRLIAPPHVHRSDDEAWYVLEGTLCFRLGDTEVEAPAGTAVYAPAGMPHTFWNPGPGAARYLLIMTPAIHRLIEEVHEPGADVSAVFARYDSELLDSRSTRSPSSSARSSSRARPGSRQGPRRSSS
jgi:mannose-6-phosphate isomerase-like protein (cupin superfamily)